MRTSSLSAVFLEINITNYSFSLIFYCSTFTILFREIIVFGNVLLCINWYTVFFLQVHYILQEVVMGGMVLETNMNEIVAQVELQNRMEKSEVSVPWPH